MNKVMLIGRLTRDPIKNEGKTLSCYFTIAINRPFLNQEGKREADFVPVIAWGKHAETILNYMKKGSQIAVEGRIQTRNYQDQGKTVYVTEVVATNFEFVGSNSNSGMSNPSNIASLNETAPPMQYSESNPSNFANNDVSTNYNQPTMDIDDANDPFLKMGESIGIEESLGIGDNELPF